MPELPEVETTKRGISSSLLNQTITNIIVRQAQLRLPVTPMLDTLCINKTVIGISRRAKYLLLHLSEGVFIIHLGMSGHLRITNSQAIIKKHDHIDLCLTNGFILRYHDPRRFGLWLYTEENIDDHSLLKHLGPEPLSNDFNSDYLERRAHKKTQSIKSFIMNNTVVVGVGNIYATESLFKVGIHPQTPAGLISKDQWIILTRVIKQVLQEAIDAGGTTLRDFYGIDGKPGYFSLALQVYGRNNLPCPLCQTLIKTVTIVGRSSTFCPNCQPRGGQEQLLAVS